MKTQRIDHITFASLASLLLTAPSLNAQSVLGSAADFGVLSGATVTSALVTPGLVISNGDVGAPSLAAITGFPPAEIINGTTIGGVNQAILDLITARNTLKAMIVPIGNDLTATPTLGGRTLSAGVYNFDVAADLTGTLTLDAGGMNNVTWVINIGTSLTTAANAKVVFINLGSNGGKDNGLFWNAGAAITFGATNIIAGNYLAGTHIAFGTTIPATGSGSGRALAVTDYVAFDGSATMDVLGTGGDLTGGLDALGNHSGYVLLSETGTYTPGTSGLVLSPGQLYNTAGVTVDGTNADTALMAPATLTVFGTSATLTETNTYTGGTFIDGAQVANPTLASSLTAGSANLPVDGTVALIDSNNTGTFGTLIFDQTTDGTFGGVISTDPMLYTVGVSKGGSVTKSGDSILTLTGLNTYAGGTIITGGTLALAGNGTLGAIDGTLSVDGSILDLGETSQTVGAVIIADGTISNGTLTGTSFDSTGGSVDANLAGNGAVFTNTSGTTTLTGINTYSGGTVVNGGSLVGNSDSLPLDGDVTLANASSLVLDQASDGTFGGVISGDGSVTKDNTGALTVTGANTYTGGTVVNGGSLIGNTDSLPLDGDVALANASSLVLDQASDGTFGGVISGDGSVTKDNTGALTVTGANTYTGGTVVNGGSLIGNTDSLPLDGGVTLANASSLVLDQASDGTFGGVISGDGSVTKDNTGVLTVTGANTYTGGTVVNGGSLIGNSDSLPLNGDVTLANASSLVLDQAADGTFGGVISGDGSVTKDNTGALTVTGTNTYTGDTFINEGALILDDGQIGKATLASGAFLRGNGTVNGDLINNGTVSPGFSPGTIVVVGNYAQGPGGTLVIEIASPVLYDQLLVGGAATLDGTLQVNLLGAYNPAGQSFTFLTAAGGVTGTFSVVTGAALATDVTYNANDVVLAFTQIPFNTFAGTPNQVAIANAAQTNPALTAALNLVPLAADLPGSLNALSPQGYEVWSDIAFAHAVSLTDRLSRVVGRDDFYFQVGQSRNTSEGDADVLSTDFNSNSGLVGGNYSLNEAFTVGAFLDYTETDAGLGSFGSRSEVKSVMPGIRFTWHQDAWFASATAAYGFDRYKSTREINFPGTSATASSKTDGHEWLIDVTGGRHFDVGIVSLSPFGGLLASGWKADGFTETGAGLLNATVDDQAAHSLRTQLGLDAALNLSVGGIGLRPNVSAAWLHELTNKSRSIDGSFSGSNFTLATRRADRDTLRLSAGIEAMITPAFAIYGNYAVQTGDTTRVIGEWNAGVSLRF